MAPSDRSDKSDRSDPSDKSDYQGPFLPHGGYRKLRSYKVAEAVYDATVVFCRRFLQADRRSADQMIQAARSGVRNISEGSGAAATSRKSDGSIRLRGLAGLSEFVEKAAPELAANAMVCAVNQGAYLVKRQLESQGRAFLEEGGFTEKLYAARTGKRQSDKSDRSDKSDSVPVCPACAKPMRLRTARKGQGAGQAFWGCSAYPKCKGTRPKH
jgi:restriction system protein